MEAASRLAKLYAGKEEAMRGEAIGLARSQHAELLRTTGELEGAASASRATMSVAAAEREAVWRERETARLGVQLQSEKEVLHSQNKTLTARIDDLQRAAERGRAAAAAEREAHASEISSLSQRLSKLLDGVEAFQLRCADGIAEHVDATDQRLGVLEAEHAHAVRAEVSKAELRLALRDRLKGLIVDARGGREVLHRDEAATTAGLMATAAMAKTSSAAASLLGSASSSPTLVPVAPQRTAALYTAVLVLATAWAIGIMLGITAPRGTWEATVRFASSSSASS
tara:strand:+ start:19 stop:870 length:852 start_codon:yes stop_codon:yes gene_type:complete